MARPVCKRNLEWSLKVCANVSGLTGACPRPRWRSARPGPHKSFGIEAPFFEPGCQGAGRPSGHLHVSFPQTSWAAQLRAARPIRLTGHGDVTQVEARSRRSVAQAIRASLLASATIAMLRWVRASSPRSHPPAATGSWQASASPLWRRG